MYTAYIGKNKYIVEFEKNALQKGRLNGESFEIDFVRENENGFHLIKDSGSYRIEIVSVNTEEKTAALKINGVLHQIVLKDEIDELLKNMGISSQTKKTVSEVKAPMPGLVTKIFAKEGDTVNRGDILLVLEAMKMENNIKSAIDGTVKKVHCSPGKPVEKNEVLIVFE
jgi:biotin carboxyl carrier protein